MSLPRQTPEDKVLWSLMAFGGSVDHKSLRRRTGMKLKELKRILKVLERRGKIGRSTLAIHQDASQQVFTLKRNFRCR